MAKVLDAVRKNPDPLLDEWLKRIKIGIRRLHAHNDCLRVQHSGHGGDVGESPSYKGIDDSLATVEGDDVDATIFPKQPGRQDDVALDGMGGNVSSRLGDNDSKLPLPQFTEFHGAGHCQCLATSMPDVAGVSRAYGKNAA